MKYACHRLSVGALLLTSVITANAQALPPQTADATTSHLATPHSATPHAAKSHTADARVANANRADASLSPGPSITTSLVSASWATAALKHDVSHLHALERRTYGKPVLRPAVEVDTPGDQMHRISQLNQDFRQREAERVQRESAASRTPGITLAGGPPLVMIPLALGIASARKWVDPDTAGTAGTASGASELLRSLGVSSGR